jgi:hypothetical protein
MISKEIIGLGIDPEKDLPEPELARDSRLKVEKNDPSFFGGGNLFQCSLRAFRFSPREKS